MVGGGGNETHKRKQYRCIRPLRSLKLDKERRRIHFIDFARVRGGRVYTFTFLQVFILFKFND